MCLIPALIFLSCKKKAPDPVHESRLRLALKHSFDAKVLFKDSMAYYNAYHDTLSFSRVSYFLSGFKLIGDHQSYSSSEVCLADVFKPNTQGFDLTRIPDGHYSTLELLFGLDSSINVFGAIPNTIDNNEMFWPVQMGGGYHFMKLEGHYLDSGKIKGYAMHIGKNGQQFKVVIPVSIDLPGDQGISLKVRLDEWFRSPYDYRFRTDGAYSMSNDALMHKLSENGHDVFELDSIW